MLRFCWVILFFCGSILNSIDGSRYCILPDGNRGMCVKIENCPTIFNITSQMSTSESEMYLKKINCGGLTLNKNRIKVCCTDTAVEDRRSILRSRSRSAIMKPTNVASPVARRRVVKEYIDKKIVTHPNYHLIPQQKCGLSLNADQPLKYPWMGVLQYVQPNVEQKICTGTIINERYVLTSASCATNQLVFVRVGGHKPETGVYDFPIDEIILHTNYSREQPMENDIALIRLATPISNAHPICLPFSSRIKSFNFKKLDVFHWNTLHESKEFQNHLLPIMSNLKCRKMFKGKGKMKINDNQLCSGGEIPNDFDKTSCKVISGGALMLLATPEQFPRTVTESKYIQVGVLSSDILCDSLFTPTIHTRVSSYIPWILDSVK